MKKSLILTLSGLIALSLTAGCKNETPEKTASPAPQASSAPATQQPAAAASQSGTVLETMDAAGYTYVQVDTGSEKIWAAAPQFAVAVGDSVLVPEGMPMTNYHSKTLDRDFELVYFVDGIMVAGAEQGEAASAAMPEGHPPTSVEAAPPAVEVDLSDVEKADGGVTVAEIFTGKDDLGGKEVSVRGKVVKFNAQIMGKNWIHLQDGSGGEGTNDLTVTTDATAEVGDTVLVSGVVTLDKDFGYGYKYDVIIEDAAVVAE